MEIEMEVGKSYLVLMASLKYYKFTLLRKNIHKKAHSGDWYPIFNNASLKVLKGTWYWSDVDKVNCEWNEALEVIYGPIEEV